MGSAADLEMTHPLKLLKTSTAELENTQSLALPVGGTSSHILERDVIQGRLGVPSTVPVFTT